MKNYRIISFVSQRNQRLGYPNCYQLNDLFIKYDAINDFSVWLRAGSNP